MTASSPTSTASAPNSPPTTVAVKPLPPCAPASPPCANAPCASKCSPTSPTPRAAPSCRSSRRRLKNANSRASSPTTCAAPTCKRCPKASGNSSRSFCGNCSPHPAAPLPGRWRPWQSACKTCWIAASSLPRLAFDGTMNHRTGKMPPCRDTIDLRLCSLRQQSQHIVSRLPRVRRLAAIVKTFR